MKLTEENYFSPEASKEYMSVSQFKTFLECEARAMAELRGEYQREETTALLVGSYIDAHFSRTLDVFRAQHPDLYTRTGSLRAEFQQAEEIIARLERDPLAMLLMGGDKQVALTGIIQGVPFKGKLDVLLNADQCAAIAAAYPDMDELLFAGGAIVDLKVMRDFQPLYKEGEGKLNFIDFWKYDLQLAIYQNLVAQHHGGELYPCYILAATKEKVPDIGLYRLPQAQLDAATQIYLGESLERAAAVKAGKVEPERCEECDYCKQTKVLTCGHYLGDW